MNFIKLPKKAIPKIMVCSKPYKGLLLYILEVIKLNPDHHNQENWRCDTQFCFAGFTDLVAKLYFDKNYKFDNFYCPSEDHSLNKGNNNLLNKIVIKERDLHKRINKQEGHTRNCVKLTIKDISNVETVARYLLGLNISQAETLFLRTYSIIDIQVTINDILEESGQIKSIFSE